jgi:HK97 gp10 family phage protein
MDFGELDALLTGVDQALSGQALQTATMPAGELVLLEAKRRAPHKTGELINHLEVQATHTAHAATVVVQVADSAPGGSVRQAIFAEFGTAHEIARPFMRPAFEVSKQAAANLVLEQIKNQLKA